MTEIEKKRKEFLNLYVEEVLQPILPNARFSSASSFGNPESIHKHAKLDVQSDNDIFLNSKYDFGTNSETIDLIHYTTLENAINIINSRSLRMYDLNYSDDPQEYKLIDNIDKSNAKNIKSTIFYTSFCEYNETNKPDSFDMWRMYGGSGSGVGIIFKIDTSNYLDWHHHHLSKIQYHENNSDNVITQFLSRHKHFHEKYDFSVTNVNSAIYKIIAFHKNAIWESENEVRLLYYDDLTRRKPEDLKDNKRLFLTLNRSYDNSYYRELPLYCNEYLIKLNKQFDKNEELISLASNIMPKVTISKIILGHKFNYELIYKINKVLRDISTYKLGYIIQSELTKHRENF